MRILLIEDDPVQAQVVRQVLESEGFTVDHLASGEDGVLAAEAVGYAAVILDLGLPGIDGIEVLARLRAAPLRVPVMILTTRAAVAERIDGLDQGADDYLAKPFDIDELVARLRALLRRPPPDITLVCDNLRLSPQRQEASVGDTPLALPRLQLLMLELMMRRPGRPVTKTLIDSVLYDSDPADTTARIHFHVSQLRKRLRAAGARVRIETFPDLGYALVVETLTPSAS